MIHEESINANKIIEFPLKKSAIVPYNYTETLLKKIALHDDRTWQTMQNLPLQFYSICNRNRVIVRASY